MILEVALVLGAIQLTLCDREHKVHNIVLYPERHSWCQTTAIKQVVASPGYESVTIDNNVCVGACYSYSIPRTQPAEPGELIGPYCDSCQPVGTRCYHVTLHADSKNVEGPKTMQKRVQIITNCSCMSCDTVQNKDCEVSDQNTSELPTDLFALLHPHASTKPGLETKPLVPEEVPELLHFVPPKDISDLGFNVNTMKTAPERTFELNTKLINLLKSIQNEEDDSNVSYDKDQLKELLEIVEGAEHELSDKSLIEFINFVNIHNSEDLELDLSKLKEVLTTFKKDQDLTDRHRNFGLGNLDRGAQNNADINRDLENLSKTGTLPKNFGIEGSHYGLGHAKGSHIGMGIQPNALENNRKATEGLGNLDRGAQNNDDINRDLENLSKTGTLPTNFGIEGSHYGLGHAKGSHIGMGIQPNALENNRKAIEESSGSHHLGEPQHIGLDIGHLIRGPHGSLAFAPDLKVEEKLNLEPDMVKPNHEGVVISYENHPKTTTIE